MGLAELRLPRKVAYVGLARLVVASGARLAGLSGERLEDLEIAVSEAATEAVRAGSPDGRLVLAFGSRGGAFEVHVQGDAPDTGTPGGGASGLWQSAGDLGRTLVEALADEVVVPRQAPDRLVLRFALPPAGPGDTGAGARESGELVP